MIIQVDRELCTGCGVCMDACTTGAIQLVDQRAVIDDVLCTHCQACAETCPNEAITAILTPAQSIIMAALPETDSRAVPGQQSETPSVTETPAPRLATLTSTTLAFLGHEVAPRLADIFFTALERRLARPATTSTTLPSTSSSRHTSQCGGERRRTRYRRGHVAKKNKKRGGDAIARKRYV
jgi:NAD-dependent dihydropyrimidine dehydrogenase PreA subunit